MARIFENGIGFGSHKAARRFLGTTALTAAGLALLSPGAQAQDHAWNNFDTQHGSISTDISIPHTTNITQHTDLYIGNSNNLDILGHQTVNIGQNGAGSLFVARSTREGDDPTRILGALNANGGVMVIDRNGVFMGPGSQVDVGSVVVSTGNISNEDLINGYDANGQYAFDNFGDGKIELNGTINVAPDHGLAGFVSPTVINNGVINAKMGKVVMAGAEKVTLDLYGDNLVEIAVEDKAAAALLENNGTINAEGGTVLMTAQAARGVVDNVINVSGVINASSATVQGGKIILGGGDAGKVAVSGTLDASGTTGGTIDVTGQDIETTATAALHVDASEGDAGSIELIAERNGHFKGNLTARAESTTGKGGFVDTSGKEYIHVDGVKVDTRAADGTAGLWLIDPADITISNTGSGDFAPAGNSTIGINHIAAALETSNVEIRTNAGTGGVGNITFDGPGIGMGIGSGIGPLTRNLTFTADNNIVFTDSFMANNIGNLHLNAGNDILFNNNVMINGGGLNATAGDNIILAAGKSLNVTGGDIVLTANNSNTADLSTIEIFGNIFTNGGNLALNSKNYFVELNTGGSIQTNGGDLTVNVTGVNGGFDIDENAVLDLGSGDAHINARRVQLGDDIKTTGAITGTAQVVTVENNKAQIQDGINVAGAGATVSVAAGTYNQGTNIVINKALTLLGAQAGVDARLESGIRTAGGAGETIIDFGGGVRQVRIESDNVTIDGFEITNATGSSNDLIYANTKPGAADNRWAGIAVRNNILHKGGDEAIQLRDVDGAIVERNNIFNMTGDGVNIADGSKDSFIQDNEIYQTRSTNGQIYVYNSDNITIQGNYIHDITSGNDGIKLGNDGFNDTGRFVGNVLNNRIDNVRQDGIAVYSSGALISGNEISRSGSTNGAIHIQSTNANLPTNVVIENNYIHDNATRGIRVSEAVNLAIRNNIFENNTLGHVVVRNSVDDANQVTITGNSFDSSGAFAVINETTGLLNASGNWWNTTDEADVLARTDGSVDITPYLATGIDADGDKTTGFQGDASGLYVTLLGVQTGSVARIQEGVNAVNAGGTVYVNNGTFSENVLINKSLTLLSKNGRDATTIEGSDSYGGLGTVQVVSGVNNVQIGDINKGFTIKGFDYALPGIEKAAVYIAGNQTNLKVIGNEIVADGEAGLLTEEPGTLDQITIDNNIFSGKTFSGDYAGIGNQFSVDNVPRALLYIGQWIDGVTFGTNKTNVTVTNNQFIGTTGGVTTGGLASGNTLATIDAVGATVTGNIFAGTTTGNGYSLRTRGENTTVTGNTFDATHTRGGHFIAAPGNSLTPVTMADIIAANTFVGNTVYADGYTGNRIIHTRIQPVVDAASVGANVMAHAGTYEEQVVINKNLTLKGANAGIDPNTGVRGDETIIKAPVSMAANFASPDNNRGVIHVVGADNVVIDGVEVDGAHRGSTNDRMVGIGYFNAGGEVKNAIVHGITDTSFNGNQRGNGIYGLNLSGVSKTLNVTNNEVYDFQKTGIVLNGANLTSTISGNHVTGFGPTNIIAQNGIQVGAGALGTVENNTVSNIGYTNSSWAASSILMNGAAAGSSVTGNTVNGTGYDFGIYAYNTPDLQITNNTITGSQNGILAYLTDGVVINGHNTIAGSREYGIWVYESDDAEVDGNEVNNTTIDAINVGESDGVVISDNTVTGAQGNGIYTDASDDVTITENTVTNTTLNNIWVDNGSNATITRNVTSGTANHTGIALRNVTGATISENSITNAGYGLYADGNTTGVKAHGNSVTNITNFLVWNNGTPEAYDASGNYWGTTNETTIANKMGGTVDFTPYLASGADTSATKGFQGDLSNVYVTLKGAQVGTTGRIQEGVNLVNVAGTVNVNAGTYTEGDININKALTVRGVNANNTIVDASGYTNGFVVDGNLGNRNAVLSYMTVKNAAQDGVLVKDTATMKFMQINRMNFENNGHHGVALYGNGAQGLTILNSNFLDNGFGGGSRGEGDVLAYQHNGDVILRNVNIQNNSPAGLADYGVQIRGADTLAPGKVELSNVNISGSYRAAQLGIQRYDGLTLSMNDVVLGGQTNAGTNSSGWGALYLSELGGNALNIGNTAFGAHSGQYITLGMGTGYYTTNNVDATGATFEGISGATATVAQNFAIENKVFHKMDDAGQGLVTWHAGNLYVTGGGDTGKIQTAVDASSVDGTVHVDSGTYTENLLLHVEGLKLTGHGTTLAYDVSNSGRGVEGNLITVTANRVNIDPFTFDGGGIAAYGTYSNGSTGLIIDGNTYQNFTTAGIGLNNTTGALITGNTLTNTGTYGVLINGGTGSTVEGGSITNTFWDSIRVLYAADTTIQNIALSHAGTSQGVNGEGSGIVFVGANGAKVDNATISDIARIGIYAGASSDIELVNNTIMNVGTGTGTSVGDSAGKFSGIHVEGTNNLSVTNNTISGATKDGINLGGLINAPYAGAVTGTVLVSDNVINKTGEDGIDVTGGTGVSITGNHVGYEEVAPGVYAAMGANNIKANGVRVISSNGADINNNFIYGVSVNGITVNQGTGIDIKDNVLNRVGQVGIRTDQIATLEMSGNDMDNVGWQGIQIEGGSAANVDDNIIRKAGGRGITVSGTNGSTVNNNTVSNVGESGIVVNGGKNANITDNVIYAVGTKGAGNWDGIQSNGVGETLNITGNFIGHTNKSGAVGAANNIRNDGIDVTNGATVTIADNVIDRVGNYGIKAHTIGTLKITDNTVGVQSAQILRGIDIASTTNAEVIGNTLDNMLTYGLFGNAVNGLKFYDNDVTGVSNAMGTGVRLTNTSNAQIGNTDQTVWVQTGFWPWQGYFQTTDRDNRISDLNMGVEIIGGDNNHIVNNTITNVHNGVKLSGSTNADVLDNTITGNSVTGIDVTDGSHFANVDGNTLTTFATGIKVSASDNVTVTDNTLSDVLNGIVATGADILRIRNNDLTGRGNVGTGIDVQSSDDVIIGGYDLVSLLGLPVYQGNAVESFQNGINANGVTLLKIQGNRVDGTGSTGTGIKVTNSNGAQIGGDGTWLSFFQSNYVNGFWDGIQSNNSNDVRIIRNTVENSNGDGIRVDSVDASNDMGVQVLNNRVNNVGRTGIWLKNQNGVLVEQNRVDGTTSFSGIRAEGGNGVIISNNRSNNTGTHGISASGVTNLGIVDNFIGMHGGNIGSDGVNVTGSGAAEILRNRINDTAGEGVYLDGSAGSHVVQNQINNTGSHAIHVNNSANSFAQVNFIGQLGGVNNIGGDGVQFSGSSQGATISGNWIANTTSTADGIGSGISVKGNVTGTQIGGAGPMANIINDVAWDGIRVDRTAGAGTGVQVLNNDIDGTGRVGIWVKNTVDADIVDNDVVRTGLSGIRVEGGSGTLISNNTVDDTGTHGISADGVLGWLTIEANKVGQNIINAIMGNGIYVMNAENVMIGGVGANENLVSGATNGVEVNNATGTIIAENNTIEDSRGIGIVFSGGTNGNIVLKGNKLTDNVTGARFESGRIDLTGASNVITRGVTGMVFDRFGGTAPMSLVAGPGDIPGTNGTFGTTVFDDNTGAFIVFANNAFSNGFNTPVKLDASYVDFDGFIPNSKPRDADGIPFLTFEEYQAIEDRVWHFGDNLWLGQILFGKLPTIGQEELFRSIDFGAFGAGGLNVRILGLPSIPGGPSAASFNNITPFAGGTNAAALNNITPAAGGEVNPADLNNITPAAGGDGGAAPQQQTAQQLNQVNTAAGDEEVGCWNDAMNLASTGQAVSLNYGGGVDDVLNSAAACGSSL